MTLATTIALFGAMVVLAITPGPGIVVVVAQTLSASLRHGLTTIIGVVVGDFVYVAFVLLGLAAITATVDSALTYLNVFGGCYLIYLGLSSLRDLGGKVSSNEHAEPSHLTSFFIGLLTTLGNPKVIFFYLSFLPAFLDLGTLSITDVLILLGCIALAVGGVMFGYAYIAYRGAAAATSEQTPSWTRYCSSILLIGSGVYLLLRLV